MRTKFQGKKKLKDQAKKIKLLYTAVLRKVTLMIV